MKRVVVVGGGFGGASVARQLVKSSWTKRAEIVLIDERAAHEYTPWLYEEATAISEQGESHIRRAHKRVCIPFARFPGLEKVRFIHAKVSDIARNGSHVVLENGTTLSADVIVVGVGAQVNDFDISGVKIHATTLKTSKDAEHIAQRLRSILRELVERHRARATVVVVGAGANGVELAAEIAEVRKTFLEAYAMDHTQVRIVLCDAGPEPVGMFPKAVRTRVRRRLKKLGVEFFGKTVIHEVTAKEVCAEGCAIPYDLLIWSAGVKSRKEPAEVWGLPVNERGRIRVNDTFVIEGKKNMFALGDAAMRGESRDPQSAQVASAQAPYVAKNILAYFEGKELRAFPKKQWQVLLAVGGSYGVGRIAGISLKGRGAFWLRRLVDAKYFLSVLPIMHAWRMWYRGGEIYGEHDAPRA